MRPKLLWPGVAAGGAGLLLWLFGERWRPLRPSTLAGLKEGGLRGLYTLNALHMYVYGRWTNQYLDVLINRIYPRLDADGLKWWRDRYHAKVLTTEQAEAILRHDHDLPLLDLGEQVIPFPMARDLVLTGNPDVAVYECGCRHARDEHCEPTQVCMIIGQPFVDFVLEHNPHSSRRLTREEAIELLRAEHERGHLHSAWFKDATFGRFYSICNCCSCCCAGIEAMVKYGSPVMASSGYVAEVDAEECAACGDCAEGCPFGAISVDDSARVDWHACMGCGVCAARCAQEAIGLVRDAAKGEPLDVRLLAL